MSKELEKAHGVDINNEYHGNDVDNFTKAMLASFSKPTKHCYYELVDANGDVKHVMMTDKKSVIMSVATRLGLDYRLVEFEETYKDLDK